MSSELDKELKSFYKFLEKQEKKYYSFVEDAENKLAESNGFSRVARRANKDIISKCKANIAIGTKLIRELDKIKDVIDGKNVSLNEEYDFNVLYSHVYFYIANDILKSKSFDNVFGVNSEMQNDTKENLIEKASILTKYFIMNSKNNNVKLNFLNCFDEKGKLIINSFYAFDTFLSNSVKFSKIDEEMTYFKKLFITNTMLREVNTRNREIEKLKEKEKEEKKLKKIKAREEKKNNPNIGKNQIEFKLNEESLLEKEIYSKYVDERTLELKKDIVDKISLDDLLELLWQLPDMTKKRILKYIDDYNNKHIKNELNKYLSLLDKNDLKILRNVFSMKSEDDKKIFESLKLFILSDEYELLDNNEIKDIISNFLNKNGELKLENKSINNNIIIFLSDNFFNEEVETILNEGQSNNKDALVSSINQQLTYLRTQSLTDISKNSNKAFHEIKDIGTGTKGSRNVPLIIGDNLKAYRYGSRKAKVCIVKLRVSEKNQMMLKEKYNCEFNPQVLVSFALGNVGIENEEEFYIRANKNAKIYEDKLNYILKLFNEDFNEEKFREACNLIDSSLIQTNTDDKEMQL